MVKSAMLQVYELVPEAYRQRFRGLRTPKMLKTAGQTYADFAREKGVLFDCSCYCLSVQPVRQIILGQCVS